MTAAITLKPLVIPDDQALVPGGASPELMHLLNDIKSRFDTIAAYQEPVIPDDVVLQTRDLIDGTVYSTSAAFPLDDTIPQSDEGAALQSLNFTPVSSDSTIRVEWSGQISGPTTSSVVVALFHSGSADAIDVKFSVTDATVIIAWVPKLLATLPSWGTTQRTFSTRFGNVNGSSTIYSGSSSNGTNRYGGAMNSALTVTEYKNS